MTVNILRYLCCYLCFALSSCVIDTVPLPEDTSHTNDIPSDDKRGSGGDTSPAPNEFDAFIDTNGFYYAGLDSPLLLVGVSRTIKFDPITACCPKIAVDNPERANWRGETLVALDGSFNMPINAAPLDTVLITVMMAGVTVDTETLSLSVPSADAYAAQKEFNDYVATYGTTPDQSDFNSIGALVLYPPDEFGIVTIVGTSTVGLMIVAANINEGNSVSATVDLNGQFILQLSATSGDQLALFPVEPAASKAGPAPMLVYVP